MAGCHSERDAIPQLEDLGLSFCVGKHSPCLSILEQDTDPCQLYGCCSAADLLVEGGKRQREFAFVNSFTIIIIIIDLLKLAMSFVVIRPFAWMYLYKTSSQNGWLTVMTEFVPSLGLHHCAVVCFRGCQQLNFISTSDENHLEQTPGPNKSRGSVCLLIKWRASPLLKRARKTVKDVD